MRKLAGACDARRRCAENLRNASREPQYVIPIEAFSNALRSQGVDFLTGVPCSYLKSFVSYANASGSLRYRVAASEGEAVGIATGAYLSGSLPMVLLQNSGLGNCINPLTSLTATFGIPMLLLVSHRGEGGADAPQHRRMGEITYDLLRTVGVSSHTLPSGLEQATAVLKAACAEARERMEPVALVVSKGCFEPYVFQEPLPQKCAHASLPAVAAPDVAALGSREDALRATVGVLQESDLVIATTGMTARELSAIDDRDANFYMMGSMGCAPAIGFGLCCNQPHRKVIVLDGDGAFLMKMGSSATIGHYRPSGLLHVLLDNGVYETTGGQPTVSGAVSFEQVGGAVGYAQVMRAGSPTELARIVRDFEVGDGPTLCTMSILGGHMTDVPRVARSPEEIRDRFREQACGRI